MTRVEQAIELMSRYAERTGLTSQRPPKRYLWTDAFAVCNWLGLARATRGEHRKHALALVTQVHDTLGKFRAGDSRTGWISGLDDGAGKAHPTRGGLRIGKPLPERGPDDVFDARLEWDRDGQYFHYLTKWMHALDVVARDTKQIEFHTWARELAEAAQRGFVYASGRGARMYWKMSVDLSRPLVTSMGHHDPLDGYITCVQLAVTASDPPAGATRLAAIAKQLRAMVDLDALATADALGLGGLLADACRVIALRGQGAAFDDAFVDAIFASAVVGLRHFSESAELRGRADRRLAFRELGLAIGLAGIAKVAPGDVPSGSRRHLDAIARFAPLRDEIEAFWIAPRNREVDTWTEHADINDVMLATCLVPEGFLTLPPPAR